MECIMECIINKNGMYPNKNGMYPNKNGMYHE